MADGNKPQRAKGNQLPSSSRRAAETLSKRGESHIVLASRNPFDIFDTDKNEFIDDSPELNSLLTKLCKKDAVTKVKAIQDLEAYFKSCEIEEQRKILKLLVSCQCNV